MSAPNLDTSQEAAALQRKLINDKTPAERAELVNAMSSGITNVALAGIRRQYPDADEGEVMIHLLRRRYGTEYVDSLPPEAIEDIRRAQTR